MSSEINNLYEFGDFRFDARTKTLRRGAATVALSPKASELLKLLVERGGELISKQEFFDAIWPDTFVEEGVLTQNIYTLRQILGADENGRQFIENAARRGYRFAAPIKVSNAGDDAARKATAENFSNENFSNENLLLKSLAAGSLSNETLPAEDLLSKNLAAETLSAENVGRRTAESAEAPPSAHKILAPQEIRTAPAAEAKLAAGADDESTGRAALNSSGESKSEKAEKRRFALTRRKITLIVLAAVLLLPAAGFGFFYLFSSADGGEAEFAPIEQARFQHLTDDGDVIYPTVSPNGELLAYARQQKGGDSLHLKQLATGTAVEILPPSPKGRRSLVFSPDGHYLFFREDSEPAVIYQTTAYGGAPKKIAERVSGDFSISPDGRTFAFFRRAVGKQQLILLNAESGAERILSSRTLPATYKSGAPAWSPDGKNLIVSASASSEPRPLLVKIDEETGREIELDVFRWREIIRFLWMPDGKNIVVTGRAADEAVSQIWLIGVNDTKARRLTNDLENYFWLSLSADGKKLVTRQQRIVSQIWVLPHGNLKNARQITHGERSADGIRGLAWTRDEKIVFASLTDTITDLHQINPDKTERRRLTENAGKDNTYPTATADGRYIFFTSHRGGDGRQIWRMNADGRDQRQMTFGTETQESAYSAAIAPDGREFYFIKTGAKPSAVWKASADGGQPQLVSPERETAKDFLAISPDGKWLAYGRAGGENPAADADEATRQIGVAATSGDSAPKIFELALRRAPLQWKHDSSGFYYIGGTPNAATLMFQPLAGGEPQKILDFPDRVFNFAWSHDGKNLLVSRGRQLGDAVMIGMM